MADVPYFKPHETGPIFPDDSKQVIDDFNTFLRASDRDVEAAVAQEDIRERAEESFKLWLAETLELINRLDPDTDPDRN